MITRRTLSFAGLLVAATAQAQPGSLDTSFDPAASTAGWASSVFGIAIQPDGRIIIVGGFNAFQGQPRGGIARLLPDGTLDTSFDPGIGVDGNLRIIYNVLLDPNGQIMIGGSFCYYDGTVMNNLARLNADGSLDTTFDAAAGTNGPVYDIAHHEGNKYLIGGMFDWYMGINMEGIIRLHDDGSLDTTFNTGGAGAGATVRCIATDADDRILIGGDFVDYNGTPAAHIARLLPDGTFDPGFDVGSGADNTVWTLAVQVDQKTIIGGAFDTVDGFATGRCARLLTDGTVDTAFMTGTGADGTVYACHVQHVGDILLGGEFTGYNGTQRPNLLRLTGSGDVDATFLPNPGPDNDVRAIAVQADLRIMIGGIFLSYDAIPRRHVARVNGTGTIGIHGPGALLLSVGPNPADDRLWITLPVGVATPSRMTVVDMHGRVVLSEDVRANSGTFNIDVQHFADGLYLLQLDGMRPVRFVKE